LNTQIWNLSPDLCEPASLPPLWDAGLFCTDAAIIRFVRGNTITFKKDIIMTTPYSAYSVPADVLADTKISETKKIEILEIWVEDEKALVRASGEGLVGGEPQLLGQAVKALETLK